MTEENNVEEGVLWTGMVYPPFQAAPPSAYTAQKAFGTPLPTSGPRRTPIEYSSDGWTERPDYGRTSLSAMPV